MTIRLAFACLSIAMALLFPGSGSARADQDNLADLECLKGTVAKVTDTAIHLTGTTFPDETLGKRDATVLIDKGTTYYDGTKKVNKASLQPGHLVLVRCRMAGKERAAVLVRIIGGKKP